MRGGLRCAARAARALIIACVTVVLAWPAQAFAHNSAERMSAHSKPAPAGHDQKGREDATRHRTVRSVWASGGKPSKQVSTADWEAAVPGVPGAAQGERVR